MAVDSRPNSAVRVPVLVVELGFFGGGVLSFCREARLELSYSFMGEWPCSYMTVARLFDLVILQGEQLMRAANES
ncbi:hypothetical protein D6T65_15720 [Arthrobacter frigidicola]|nr:hypothetical protein D6T65_15720 [Arthrobacter frigidicola]